MRELWIAVWACLVAPCFAQFEYAQDKPNLGQAIGQGAATVVADYEARIKLLEGMVGVYVPTYTWPGSNGPEPFEALRKHMDGEIIHPKRDVSKWTYTELAYVHDREHVQELLDEGKALPLLKDQRLRDWVRSKHPAKALPRLTRGIVRKIVMHTQPNCPPCERWKQEQQPKAEADGVTIEFKPPNGKSTPWFEICSDDKCVVMSGYVAYETMLNAVK